MFFDSFAELWSMGGHGPYVWSAYAIGWLVMLALVMVPLRRHRRMLDLIRRQLQEEV